jgi:hypothetical protein
MKAKNYLQFLLLFTFLFVLMTGCRVHPTRKHPKGVIIESRPAGKKSIEKMEKIEEKKDAKLSYQGKVKKHKKRR